MKTHFSLCLLLIFMAGLQPLFAVDTLSLEEALQKKLISLQVRGKGGYNGECLVVRAKNLSREPQTVIIPPGWVFASADSGVQDLIHTGEILLAFVPGEIRQVFLQTMCTQHNNMGPSAGEVFRVGGMAKEGLVQLARLIAQKGYHNSTAQSAVWAVADRAPVSMMYGKDSLMVRDLADVVSEVTGIPLSSFDFRPRPHQITSINTSLDCIVPRHLAAARLAVYDESGQVVQQYFEGKKLEPGFRQFRVGVFHTRGDSLRLFLRLTEGEQIVDEKEIFVGDTIPPLQRYQTQVVVNYETSENVSADIAVYDAADSLNFILAEGKEIQPGHHRSTFIVGTHLPAGQTFWLKVKTPEGRVLTEAQLDSLGPEPERHAPQQEQGVFSCDVDQPLTNARLVIYDERDAVIRVLFENSKIYPGTKRYTYSFTHGLGPEAKFTIRLEDRVGGTIAEQCIHCP